MGKHKFQKVPLSEQECEQVLAQCSTSEFVGLRDLTFLAMIMDTLVPPREAKRTSVTDVDMMQSVITVSSMPTGNFSMSTPMSTLMRHYLLKRTSMQPTTDALFVTLAGKPVAESYFDVAIREYARLAHIQRSQPCTLELWHYSSVMHLLQVRIPSI